MSRLVCVWCEKPAMNRGSASARIHDLLDSTLGEWWTVDQISERLAVSRSTVAKALSRFVQVGAIEVREGRNDGRHPWRYRINRPPVDRSWPATVTRGYLCSCGVFLPDPHNHGLRVILGDHRFEHVNGMSRAELEAELVS